jgi:pheromone shutdown protein TraB
MRALIYFPIIHSPKDLGSLGKAATDLRSDTQENKYLDAVKQFWEVVAKTIDGLELDYNGLKLYQDGLPVCGKEQEIVAEVAKSGSENYRLLQTLNQKGAVIMGTESPELLVKERDLMVRMLNSTEFVETSLENAQTLLNQRDEYIAQRIAQTLQDNEMGMLFLGLMHDIEARLPEDIFLIEPLGKPSVLKGVS